MNDTLRAPNALLAATGTTIFTVMSALAAEHQAINLGQGFPDYEGPRDVVETAAAALLDGRNQYAPLMGLPELREAVARINARFYGIEVNPATEVVVTSGGTEALTASMVALLNPGDEIVLIEPLYDTYLPVVRMLGAVPKLVRLSPPNWELPREELAAAFGPKTKAILFNSPMNPTGKVFSLDELEFIASLLVRHNAYAICDEVYEHLVFAPARHIPLMTLPGMRERCLRIGSAGKTFSLTGWKVGYVTASGPLAALVAKAHQNLIFATPPNLQRAVAFGLGKEDGFFAELGVSLAARCRLLSDGLREAGFKVLPSAGGYFVVADFSALRGGDDVAFSRYLTSEAGVAAIPVSAFYASEAPAHYVRFAYCKSVPLLEAAVARLKNHFR